MSNSAKMPINKYTEKTHNKATHNTPVRDEEGSQ